MHCSVGFAIFVNVAPISDRFDGGTQSVSMFGTPVSLSRAIKPHEGLCLQQRRPHDREGNRKRLPDAPSVPSYAACTGARTLRADLVTLSVIASGAQVPGTRRSGPAPSYRLKQNRQESLLRYGKTYRARWEP